MDIILNRLIFETIPIPEESPFNSNDYSISYLEQLENRFT